MKIVWAENPNTSIPQLVHFACLTSDQERATVQSFTTRIPNNTVCPRCNLSLLDGQPVKELPKSDRPAGIFALQDALDFAARHESTTAEAKRIDRTIHETLPMPTHVTRRREPDPNYDTLAEKNMDRDDDDYE